MSINRHTGRRNIVTRRETLFRQQRGKCYWCKQDMKLRVEIKPGERHDPRMCTLDHIEDRWSDRRGNVKNKNVAACAECNQRRSAEREAEIMKNSRRAMGRDYIAECVGDRPPHAGALYTAGGEIP